MNNSRYFRIKKRVYDIIDLSTPDDIPSIIFISTIMALIFLTLVAIILQSVPEINQQYHSWFRLFEIFSVTIFTIEYLLRIWTCNVVERFSKGSVKGRIRFMLQPMSLVDLAAILPFYFPLFIAMDLRFIRALRLFRLFRLVKMGRYSRSYKIISRVIFSRRQELTVTFVLVFQLTLLLSAFMYFVERPVQPEAFPSIPHCILWGMGTLMSVDVGCADPVTLAGKIAGLIIGFLRVGIFMLPAGIMASGFTEFRENIRQ